MFLLFHDIGIPWWVAYPALVVVLVCFLVAVYGIYVLVRFRDTQPFRYMAYAYGVFLIFWVLYLASNSSGLGTICTWLGVPFGFIGGIPFLALVSFMLGSFFTGEISEFISNPGAAAINIIAINGLIHFFRLRLKKERLAYPD